MKFLNLSVITLVVAFSCGVKRIYLDNLILFLDYLDIFQITAPLLDVIYSSEEKDKVAPFLVTLLYNILPYLKHHR